MSWITKQRLMARLAKAVGHRRHAEVIAISDEILRNDSRYVPALAIKANALAALGRASDATKIWESIVRIDEKNFPALRKLTDYYLSVGESHLARIYAERAINSYTPTELSVSSLMLVRWMGRLLGARDDMAAVATRDQERIDADAARWLSEMRLFLNEPNGDSAN